MENENKTVYVPIDNNELQKEYIEKLNSDPIYSLEVDPTGEYKMTQSQKDFILQFLQYNNIPIVCELLHMEEDTARGYLLQPSTQNELNRIRQARYQRQFANKLINIDQIGSYLTSMLTDYNVPVYEQLSMKQRLKVVELLIKVNDMKNKAIDRPIELINTKEVVEQVKDMSPNDIKKLIDKSQDKKLSLEKELIITQLNKDNDLTQEDIEYLRSLSVEELKKLNQGDK